MISQITRRFFSIQTSQVPKFPRTLLELASSVKTCLSINDDLQGGINEPQYLERRQQIIETSSKYKIETSVVPEIEYNKDERQIWKSVYLDLLEQQEKAAPQQIYKSFIKLEKSLSMSPLNMPQLQEISRYHYDSYGWRLRPVFGLLTLQEFLNQLAFQIWPATQYIRPRPCKYYNPEPDFIHEVFGHQAMLGLPQCRNTLYKIGLASLGAGEQQLEQLAAAYWYTFEVGLCLDDEGKHKKILGGAVLSSIEEGHLALSDKAKIIDFDLQLITNKHYRSSIQYTGHQPFYVLSPPINELCNILDHWVNGLIEEKNFIPSFNPITQEIDVSLR